MESFPKIKKQDGVTLALYRYECGHERVIVMDSPLRRRMGAPPIKTAGFRKCPVHGKAPCLLPNASHQTAGEYDHAQQDQG
jgi:hypothetical protein